MSLAHVPVSGSVRISGVRGRGPVSYRLMELGFIDGAAATVMGRAPLGDPIRVRVGESQVSLRHEEAELVEVTSE